MKEIFFLGLLVTFSCNADLCDDLYEKHKSDWEGKPNLSICKNALKGDPEAQFDLGGWYKLEAKKPTEAFEWVRKSADQRCAKSQFVLGLLYFDGEGVDRNWFYAFELVENAANNGIPQAMTFLGHMYQNGYATAKNARKAKRWYLAAAKLGDATAYSYLGNMYKNGDGVDTDNEKAADYFVSAINYNVKTALTKDNNTYPCNEYDVLKSKN
ncbi:tetratricopeptide repeat protein [Providencia sp. PROV032]|uniref:tetratricopeptide repeat protein n=1 Tax=Providencia sp. PROV032 TaxID=2949764 RepID=UPI00234A6B79|nr:tetratricopeptide repeat protein [Providencia sp. PROV032]